MLIRIQSLAFGGNRGMWIGFRRPVTDELAVSDNLDTSGLQILKKDILDHALVNQKNERVFYVHHIGRIVDLTLRSTQWR